MTTTNNTKTVQTTVTMEQLAAATGGMGGGSAHVWVECPVSYDPARITADDIVNDSQIRQVDAPSA